MVPVVLTLYAGEEDYQYRLDHEPDGVAALHPHQIERMVHEVLCSVTYTHYMRLTSMCQPSARFVRRSGTRFFFRGSPQGE